MISKNNLTGLALMLVFAFASINTSQAFDQPSVGPNAPAWDGDFQTNILGNNNDSNKFSSANVVENADGSILERLQFIQSKLTANPVFDDRFTIADDPSTPNSVFQFLTAKVDEYKTAILKIGEDENSLLNALKITSDGSDVVRIGVDLAGDNPTESIDVGGTLRMRALNCSTFNNGGKVTTDANGIMQCAHDDSTTSEGTGADNDGANKGTQGPGIRGLYDGMSSDTLQFKSIQAGANIALDSDTNPSTVIINATDTVLDESAVDSYVSNNSYATTTALSANYLPKYSVDSDDLVESILFDDGDRLGIGTNAPSAQTKVHISAPSGSAVLRTTSVTGTNSIDITASSTPGNTFIEATDNAAIKIGHTSGTKMTITNHADGGRVGIGNANPQGSIHINGDLATDSDAASLTLKQDGT